MAAKCAAFGFRGFSSADRFFNGSATPAGLSFGPGTEEKCSPVVRFDFFHKLYYIWHNVPDLGVDFRPLWEKADDPEGWDGDGHYICAHVHGA